MIRLLAVLLLWMVSPSSALSLKVEIRWHDWPIEIPASGLATPSGEKIDVTRLDFLLNQPKIKLSSGREVEASSWHSYVHGEALGLLRFPKLPDEPIEALVLHLGPSDEVNRSDPNQYPAKHALNPIRNGLHWDPQQGYIFLALEGRLTGKDLAYAYHYGNSSNRLALPFSGPLEPNGVYRLTLHLDRLFVAPFRVADQTSTHSRPDDPILPHFRRTIADAFSLTRIGEEEPRADVAKSGSAKFIGTPYAFKMPGKFPRPVLPTDYPLSEERVELGKRLFFDPALSVTNSTSCASCHEPDQVFSDALPLSKGHAGGETLRHSMPLVNLAWKTGVPFRWDGDAASLREQILRPIEDPLEMGENLENLPDKLSKQERYPDLFESAFGDPAITPERLAVAMEQFLISLTSFDSKFDRAARGKTELTDQEQRGFELFMTENDPRLGLRGADCFHCHSGAFFTSHRFHNNGLPPTNEDKGLEIATGRASDRGRFSTPSLRNVALTAPYMHDGRFSTLEEVMDFYSEGIHRSPTLDPNIAKHPGKGLGLNDEEKAALVAFLKTLSDPAYLEDNSHSE